MADELLLAIETSGSQGGVGLTRGAQTLGLRRLAADRRHAAELLPTIRELLDEHERRLMDVDVFAYSCGPGSFTGLRVAATIARMMQSTVGCRVVAVPTLEVIARNALAHPARPTRIVALLDARRGQVYAAEFERVDDDTLRCVIDAAVHEPAALLDAIEPPFWIVGEGVHACSTGVWGVAGRGGRRVVLAAVGRAGDGDRPADGGGGSGLPTGADRAALPPPAGVRGGLRATSRRSPPPPWGVSIHQNPKRKRGPVLSGRSGGQATSGTQRGPAPSVLTSCAPGTACPRCAWAWHLASLLRADVACSGTACPRCAWAWHLVWHLALGAWSGNHGCLPDEDS